MNWKNFVQLRESNDSEESNKKSSDNGALGSKISLGDGNDYPPFWVSDDPKSEHYGKNKNLAPIVRAFKEGANWGWSKDDKSGDDKPVKISGKKLYLSGGAVRDHLVGRKARNIELATNGSPDEVYHLLKQNGFEFVDEGGKRSMANKDKPHPNRKEGTKQYFWVKKTSKNGRPYTFGVRVNEDEFDLDVFMKTPRGNVGVDPESGTQAQDAGGRDFTINSMYIALTNDNGPNKELNDFFGGVHHLSSGKIASVGDMGKKFKEDPSRILRYARMLNDYGDPKKVSEEDKNVVKKMSKEIGSMDRKTTMGEFKRGMEKDDCDARKYLKIFGDLGLLDSIFPGKALDTEIPKELSEIGDKHMPIAYMLRQNDPATLGDTGMDPDDLQKIGFLIKSLGLSENISSKALGDLTYGYHTSGITTRKLREWALKVGHLEADVVDAFLEHLKQPRIRAVIIGENGQEHPDERFIDLYDPFTGEPDSMRITERKRELEYKNFVKQLSFMRPS